MGTIPIVDIHTHTIPQSFVDEVRRDSGRHGYSIRRRANGLEELITPDWPTDAPPEKDLGQEVVQKRTDEAFRQREMRAARIDVSVEGILPPLMSYGGDPTQAEWGARAINDGLAANCAAFPQNVHGMAHVPLQSPELAAKELTRVVERYGFRAVQIGANVRGENLDVRELDPFWDAAQSLGVLVFVHPEHPSGLLRLRKYWLVNLVGNPLETTIAGACLIFGGVLERYPRLNVCLAHAGGYTPWIQGRWRHGAEVRPETKERGATGGFDQYFRRLYFDTVIHDPRTLRFLIDSVGSDRVLHGTDYAADMGDWTQVPTIRGMAGLSESDKTDVLGANALRLMGRAV
ncbi:MAG: amidohydrolase [Chloroflexota bacterium]|nr:amidohydrolase [Chloroflexota bacterium]